MPEDDYQPLSRWVTGAIWTLVIGGNLILAWDAWRDTEAGLAFRARMRDRFAKLKDCEPCARRRAFLKAKGRMLWDATRAVEGDPIETVADVVPPGQ